MDTTDASWSVPESASEENMSVFYSRPYHKVVCAREGGERERARERESKREREQEREQEREREREKRRRDRKWACTPGAGWNGGQVNGGQVPPQTA